MKQKVSNQVKDWLRQTLLDRKQREPEVRLPKDPEKSSAVFSSDEQLEGTNESIQNLEVDELFDEIEHIESKNLAIPAPVNQMDKRKNSSALLPPENGEKKEAKGLIDGSDRREAKGVSQAAIEDIEEKSIRRNSNNFVRLRSKKTSQISKEGWAALEKKTEGIQVKIISYE